MAGNQEWSTSPDLWAAIVGRYGEFDLDACASEENAKCEIYINEQEDALSNEQPWIGRIGRTSYHDPRGVELDLAASVYINPGFAKPAEWAYKSYREAQKREDSLCLMMGLGSHSTVWFRWCYEHCYQILDLSPRPQFIPPPGVEKSSNARENCLFEFRHKDYSGPIISGYKRAPWRWRP